MAPVDPKIRVRVLHEDPATAAALVEALAPAFEVLEGEPVEGEAVDVRVVSDDLARVERELAGAEVERLKREKVEQQRTIKRLQREIAAGAVRLEEAGERLRRLASTDGLTGLYNHRYFQVVWRREITRARRYGEEISVMLVDIDRFEALNDAHGQAAGDEVLRELAQLLLRGVRAVDLVARFGGEEFVVSLPRTGKASAELLAGRLREKVEAHTFPFADGQPDGRLTVSIGVATFPDDGESAGAIIARAGAAARRAKRAGRNRVAGAIPEDPDTDSFEALVRGPGRPR